MFWRSSAASLAPDDLAGSYPKMRATAGAQPDGRVQRHAPARIERDVPAWLDVLQQHHFEALPASARAAQANTPVFAIFPREHQASERQLRRQRVRFDNTQRSART